MQARGWAACNMRGLAAVCVDAFDNTGRDDAVTMQHLPYDMDGFDDEASQVWVDMLDNTGGQDDMVMAQHVSYSMRGFAAAAANR